MASSLEVAELRVRGVHLTKAIFIGAGHHSDALEPGAPAAGAAKFEC